MNVREEARKVGGEELVAKIDKAKALEGSILRRVGALMGEVIASAGGDKDEQELVLTALCEALSDAYAYAVVKYADASGTQECEAVVMAVQSVSHNIQTRQEDAKAAKMGVGDKIKSLFKGAKQ